MRKMIIFLLVISMFLSVGCFKVYKIIKVKSDLSGTIVFHMILDMGPVIKFMSEGFPGGGQPGGGMTKKGKGISEDQLKAKLPQGIRLVSVKEKTVGNKTGTRIELAFDHILDLNKLRKLDIENKPFSNLKVTKRGEEISIAMRLDRTPGKDKGNQAPPAMKKKMEAIFVDASINVKIKLSKAFRIVDDNATKAGMGNALYWQYKVLNFKKEDFPLIMNAKFKKK